MAPKHHLQPPEGKNLKRAKSSATPASRSMTPAEIVPEVVPFKVFYLDGDAGKKSKKEQELYKHAQEHASPFVAKGAESNGELDQRYTVVPWAQWDGMKKYNNFIIQGEMYKRDNIVFIRNAETPQPDGDKDDIEENDKDFWVAYILEVRAVSAQHVYALVAWMYWPDDLPLPKTRSPDQVSPDSGRRTYHGDHELIPSNHLEVLDVLSIAGKAKVINWEEKDDDPRNKLYWRQTLSRQTQALSGIREHCTCKGHYNPDVSMYICDNPSCKTWLHKACVMDAILAKTYDKLNGKKPPRLSNATTKTNSKGKTKPKLYEGKLLGRIIDDSPPMIEIKDLRPGHVREWRERIECPMCETELE